MAKEHRFAPMAVATLKENISEVISQAIFSGKLKPGERLNESQLARDFKVSRAPIREALQALQEQGLVLNSPRRGMFVVLLEDEDIAKIYPVRVILEAESFRQARARMTKADEAKLLQLLERIEKSESAPPAARARADFDFHKAVWSVTGNEYLERALHSLTAPLFAQAVLRMAQSEAARHIVLSHRPLMAYLQGKSKVPADQLIADHLRLSWQPDRPPETAG